MPLFRALAKNMAPMTNADESPYAFSYLPVSLYSIYSLSRLHLYDVCFWNLVLMLRTHQLCKGL